MLRRVWVLLFCVLFLPLQTFAKASVELLEQNTNKAVQMSKMDLSKNLSYGISDPVKQLLKERNALIIELLGQNPKSVSSFLLKKEITGSFPRHLQFYLEKEVNDLPGVIEVRVAIQKNGLEFYQYVLITDNNDIYNLYFTDQLTKDLQTGTRVIVKKAFSIKSITDVNYLILNPKDIIIKSLPAKLVSVSDAFGPENTAVILVNFQDQPTNFPWTPAEVQDIVFNKVNNEFKNFSYQQTSVVGNVFGWYTIPLNSTANCSTITNNVPILARAAAEAAGVDLSPYIRQGFIFPRTNSCVWAGLGTVGRIGSFSQFWMNGYVNYGFIAHEMGHNLTLHHSHSLKCTNGSNQGTCTSLAYGDNADTMGGSAGHFNAFQKEILGWLNFNVSPPIITVTGNGVYTIEPYETVSNNPKALKILKQNLPDGSKDYYYVEFRQPLNSDTVLQSCTACDYFKGVIIHTGNSKDSNTSQLLDMSPADGDSNKIALLPGQSFTNPNAANGGVTIATNSISSAGAIVNVTFGALPPCTHQPPTVYYSPYTPQNIKAGEKATVIVTILNNDGPACAASTFTIKPTVDSPLISAVATPPSLTVSPAARADSNVVITATTSAVPGTTYSTTVDISDTVLGRPQSFVSKVVIQNPCPSK